MNPLMPYKYKKENRQKQNNITFQQPIFQKIRILANDQSKNTKNTKTKLQSVEFCFICHFSLIH